MKKLLFFALTAIAISFASCKKEPPKFIPDDTPQTEVDSVAETTKDFVTALSDKDGDKIVSLRNDFTAKVKEIVKKNENSYTRDKIKMQLSIIQQWISDNKEEVIRLLGEKGTPIVNTFLELKMPEVVN